jgi:hypothetical protein
MNFYETEKLNWLMDILHERFGHKFNLQFDSKNFLILSLPNDERFISFIADPNTFTQADSNLPCIYWDSNVEGWKSVFCSPLPAPGAGKLPMPLISSTDQGMHINYDILGLTYWMLNRLEEIGSTDLDDHGRFPATSSHAYKHGYLERPVVDEWLYILGQVIQRTWPKIELRRHIFKTKVSHDVDQPSRYGFRNFPGILGAIAVDVIKRRDIRAMILAPLVRLNTRTQIHPADPANTFDWIMEVSEQQGLRSSFNFICGNNSPYDADYEPEHPAIRHLMRRIHGRGHEIGLHPSYSSYQMPNLIYQEAARLRKIFVEEDIKQAELGGRMHYLRWQTPITMRALSNAGMTYDSTLGYADRPGFRCGTCFEYPAFDPIAQEILPLRVRPLIVMDVSITAASYLGLGFGASAFNYFNSIKQACKKVEGTFTLLWHNCNLAHAEQKNLYENVLK